MGWGDATDPAPPRSDRRMPANCTVQPCPCVPMQSMRVTALEYVNDHGVLTNYQTDFKSGGQKYPKPEWTSSHAYPVSYSMDQYIELYLTVEVKPANACPEVGTLTGKTKGGLLFEAKNWTFRPGVNKIFMIAHTALQHEIQSGEFEVHWEVSGTSARLADTTSNMMYVTYDTPYNDTKDTKFEPTDEPSNHQDNEITEKRLDNEVTEPRLKWICTLTKGDTNGHDSLQKVHALRPPRSRGGGRLLTYETLDQFRFFDHE
jgi:hypothetical protein